MFSYSQLLDELDYFVKRGATVGSIGKSEYGNIIPYIKIGNDERESVIVTGAIHARENLTSALVLMQARYALEREFAGAIYFVPMLNPDGVILVEKGARAFGQKAKELLKINGSTDFSLWKANINGIDLNVNFDARWGKGKSNIFHPSSQNFVGKVPNSESEVRAIVDFTLKVNPRATVSYHAKGEQLIWYFHQTPLRQERDRAIAMRLNEKLRYVLQNSATNSVGGYKDWCISRLGIPAFTVEIISDYYAHPLSDCALDYEQINKNIDLPLILLDAVREKRGSNE